MQIDFSKKPISAPGKTDYFNQLLGGGKGDIVQIPIAQLIPFSKHPFKPYTAEKLAELSEDITQHGVLSPILVRQCESGYEILAGHNRVNACKLIEVDTIPAIIKEVDDDMATLIMLNTNLNQRDELLPSEKAFAYKMQLETMKRQGERTDLTSRQLVGKLESADLISNSESGRQIQRYIRLTYLIPSYLDMVDEKTLPFMVGVDLSYITEDKQKEIYSFCQANKIKNISLNQSALLKLNRDHINEAVLKDIFKQLEKPEKEKTISIKLPQNLFPDIAKVKTDSVLLQRIAETIRAYYKEQLQ